MKKIIIIPSIVFLLVVNFDLKSSIIEEKKKSYKKKWSNYLGKKNWYESKEICALMMMRLPTILEVEEAYKIGLTENWETNGIFYWTSDEYSKSGAYTFVVTSGSTLGFNKIRDIEYTSLRCIR